MSIVIGYKKGDRVYMGTDTRVVVDDYKRTEICPCNYKIQQLENDILVGIVGERAERQAIFAHSDIFTLDKKGALTPRHIINEIIPSLLSVLDDEKLLVQKEGELPYMKAQILLAYKDTLYGLCSNFVVSKNEDFLILGKGSVSLYGQAVLFNTKEEDDIPKRIVKALNVTAKHSQMVGAPYLLIDTKDLTYKLIGENN